ncbi:MAG TPA: hypothetical protein VFT04_01340 [Gemmatimonadales bacterium]|nr:hypothetical protein [Gemmatimonadales bacterium]
MRIRALIVAGFAAMSLAPENLESQQRSERWEVAAAVLPLPDSMRAGARVLIFRGPDLIEVRPGTNEMVCLGDDPAHKGFQASCYHRSLEPFMAKGRELRAAGITKREAVDSARLADVKSGRIVMPSSAILSSVFAESDSFDALAGPPGKHTALDVIYLPFATQESSGITEQPAVDRPWLMFAGKPWAHVMLSR